METAFFHQAPLLAVVGQGDRRNEAGRLKVWNVETGELVEDRTPAGHPGWLYSVCISPDDRWIAFQARISPARLQVFIAPFRDGAPGAAEREWIPVTNPSTLGRSAEWSPDGNLLYLASERDGFLCLWAQHLDRVSKRPVGPPLEIYHFHHSRRSLTNVPAGGLRISVVSEKIVFPICERSGNIWMMQLPSNE